MDEALLLFDKMEVKGGIKVPQSLLFSKDTKFRREDVRRLMVYETIAKALATSWGLQQRESSYC